MLRGLCGKILQFFYSENCLLDIARQFPLKLDKLPGNNIIIVATRYPEAGKPFSGGMAPAVYQACKGFDYKFWYGYGERSKKPSFLGRAVKGAFDAAFEKPSAVKAHDVEGFRVRQVIARKHIWDLQYNEFCNRWVWPVCHNLLHFAKLPKHWDTFGNRKANYDIASRIQADLGNDDQTPIWIHDYHHLPMAEALRNLGVKNPIVYFHHIPLPEPGTLALAGEKEKKEFIEMLNALKACDAVMFQTEEITKRFYRLIGEVAPEEIPAYAGHFLKIDGENLRDENMVYVGHAPISINTEHEMEVAKQPIAEDDADALELAGKLKAKYVFINFERCDYSKGILQRVEAFKKLIEENSEIRGQVQLVLGAEPTRSDIEQYKEYAAAVRIITEEINNDASLWIDGQPPVIFNNKRINHDSVVKLMRTHSEDQRVIGLVSSHEDGQNLTAKEFVAAQNLKLASPLIVSNGVGASAELVSGNSGAIGYESVLGLDEQQNLNDKCSQTIQNIYNAMVQAVKMPQEEANERAEFMLDKVKENSITRWAAHFSGVIKSIQKGTFFPKQEISQTFAYTPT